MNNIDVKIISFKTADKIQISKFLDDLGIIHSISPAVDVKNTSIDLFDKFGAQVLYGRDLRGGEIGCALAHFKAMYEFTFSECEWLFVFEDDALLEKDFFDFYQKTKYFDSKSPEIFLLGHSRTLKRNILFQRAKHPLTNIKIVNEKYFGQNDWVNACGVGTVGYLINKNAALKITKNNKIFWLADDWQSISNMGIDIFHPYIPIVWENFQNSSSGTGNSIKPHHNFFSKKIMREIFEIIYGRLRTFFYKKY